jgi:hypothetical protein
MPKFIDVQGMGISSQARTGHGLSGKSDRGVGGAIGDFFSKTTDPFGTVSDAYHAVTGTPTASDKRDAAALANAQIQAYKDATDLTRQGIEEARKQRETERRRIEEKQIRGLRNRSGRGGLMSSQSDSSNKLGSGSALPSKLGTA